MWFGVILDSGMLPRSFKNAMSGSGLHSRKLREGRDEMRDLGGSIVSVSSLRSTQTPASGIRGARSLSGDCFLCLPVSHPSCLGAYNAP